jgi:proteasome lid subunit RPN8/RPN11
MPRETRSFTYVGELLISRQNYDQLLTWAQSLNEINFICFGRGKVIQQIERLPNTSRYPWKYASYNEGVQRKTIKLKEKEGLKVLATGHSHPRKCHNQHPSRMDIEAIKNGKIEIIVFPPINKVRAWKISKNLQSTLDSEVQLIII